MEEKLKTECRICLSTIARENIVFGGSVRELIETLFIDLGIAATENFIICKMCDQKIRHAYAFKTVCLNTEEHLLPLYRSETEEQIDASVSNTSNNCRLCKYVLDGLEVFHLDKMMVFETIKEIFQKHIPELDLLAIKNPLLCKICRNCLVDFQNLLIQIKRQHWGRGVQLKETRFVNIKSIARKPKQDTQKVTKVVLVPKQKMYVNKWNEERAAKTSSQKTPTTVSRCESNPQRPKISSRCKSNPQKPIIASRCESITQKPIIKCYKCTFETEDPVAHQKHMNFVHTKVYQCIWCSFSTTIEMSLQSHLLYHDEIRPTIASSSETNPQRSIIVSRCESKPQEPLIALRCESNPQKPIIRCFKCTFETDDPVAHQKHMNFIHTEVYQCIWCSFSTTIEMSLHSHLLYHDEIRSQNHYSIHECELCDFQTTELKDLKQHIDTHM